MVDARHAVCEEEFFGINLGVDPKVGWHMSLTVADSFPFVFVFVFLSNG